MLRPQHTADVEPARLDEAIALVRGAQIAACKADKWPAEAIACMAAAKDQAVMAACAPTMGTANDSLRKVMFDVGPKLMGMMKPGHGPRG